MLFDRCGTSIYMAPDIIHRQGYYGPAVDIWSSGISLWAIMMGNVPFKSPYDTKDMSEYNILYA